MSEAINRMSNQEANKTVARPESMDRNGPMASLPAFNNVMITNLIDAKVRALAPMIVIYLVCYIGVTYSAASPKTSWR